MYMIYKIHSWLRKEVKGGCEIEFFQTNIFNNIYIYIYKSRLLFLIHTIIFFYWFPSKWEGIGKIWCPPTFSCFFPYVSKIKPWDKLFWTAFFHLEWFHYYFYVSNTYMIVWFCFQKVYLYQVFNFFLIFAI